MPPGFAEVENGIFAFPQEIVSSIKRLFMCMIEGEGELWQFNF